MTELVHRQAKIIRDAVQDYRSRKLSLNSLVQRIDGASLAANAETFRVRLFPLILELEQVNASALSGDRIVPPAEVEIVDRALDRLLRLVGEFVTD